jgi:chemotaxis protein methyltransferase CheR
MNDSQCVAFLQWALPQLGMRWAGFRKVRRQVCKRLRRRLAELGLTDLHVYRAYLQRHPEEWAVLDGLTHITISRFYRDRGVWAFLQREVLPVLAAGALARNSETIEVWSTGCASGEEAYTLAIMWQLELGPSFALAIRILATDVDAPILRRARRGCFAAGSLTELPERWRAAAFAHHDRRHCVRDSFKQHVTIARHDIRRSPPRGPFDLVLCRNLAFTYFDRELQRVTASRIATTLQPGGALVLGSHETLPSNLAELERWSTDEQTYRRVSQ